MVTMHTIKQYADEVRRTLDMDGDRLVFAAWLAEECGEVMGQARRWAQCAKNMDVVRAGESLDKLDEELGDLIWHAFALAILMGFDPLDMLRRNVDKLRTRYPDGFVPGGGIR